MSQKSLYKTNLKEHFQYHATWLPSRPIEIGQVGMLHDKVFTPYTSLEKLGIEAVVKTKTSEDSLSYTSEGSVAFTTKLSGQMPPDVSAGLAEADAGIVVELNKENAIVFKIKGFDTHQIENLAEVEEAVLKLYGTNAWKGKYVIITEVIEARSATILISNSSNAKLELKANAKVQADKIDIADAALELTPVRKSGLSTEIIAEGGITPLYKIMGIKRKFWGLGAATGLQMKSIDTKGEQAFEEIDDLSEYDVD